MRLYEIIVLIKTQQLSKKTLQILYLNFNCTNIYINNIHFFKKIKSAETRYIASNSPNH